MHGTNAIESAKSLEATLCTHRSATDEERCLAPAVVDGIVRERLHRMFLAPDVGGHPADPLEAIASYEILAGVEAAVPWICWNNALVCMFARFLEPAVRKELFSHASDLFAQSTRPMGVAVPTANGFRVDGRWDLVSGCTHAAWLMLHCRVAPSKEAPSAAGDETRFVFVRRDDVEILDTWNVGGLRGTGSHDVVVDGVDVPAGLTLTPGPPTSESSAPIERVPVMVTMGVGFASQTLGVARACVEASLSLWTGKAGDDRPDAYRSIVMHEAAVLSARAHLMECTEAIWQGACAGEVPQATLLANAYASADWANEVARRVVDAMYALGGTRSLYTDGPFDRAHRDLHAMLRHIVAQPLWAEDAGRVRLGRAAKDPLFAL